MNLRNFKIGTWQTLLLSALSLILVVVGFLFAALFGSFVVQGVTRPLKKAVDVAGQVASGKLDSLIVRERTDETIKLIEALAKMKAVLVHFQTQQNTMAAKHEAGLIDQFILAGNLPGTSGNGGLHQCHG